MSIIIGGVIFISGLALAQETTEEIQQNLENSAGQTASEAEILRSKIEAKNAELQKILEEREQIVRQLEEASEQRATLQRELRNIDAVINQLNLSIKANQLILERLELEIESLANEIKNIETSIENQKATIAKLFVELQQKDKENLLIIFLKNQSLAESVSEAQSITNLNLNLNESANRLRNLRQDLIYKLNEEQTKKRQQEIERKNLIYRQEMVSEQKSVKATILAQTKNQERLYEQQIAELDKRQEEISAVIEEIENKLRAAFDPSLLPLKRPGVLALPVENAFITQLYGATKFAQRAYRSKTHTGIDFGAPLGTPIFAASDGVVAAVDSNDRGTSRWQRYQYGLYVVIDHENNLSTLYAHLSKITVSRGDRVKQGDLIGYSGNTGYSFGPHLHFTVYWTPSVQYKKIAPAAGLVPVGVTIDPMDYLPKVSAVSADPR